MSEFISSPHAYTYYILYIIYNKKTNRFHYFFLLVVARIPKFNSSYIIQHSTHKEKLNKEWPLFPKSLLPRWFVC